MHHAYYQGLLDVSDGEGLKLLHHSSGVLGSTYWHTIIQVQSAKNQQQLGHALSKNPATHQMYSCAWQSKLLLNGI